MANHFIYDEPLVGFADGNDPLFTEYKTIIDTTHLTPRESLARTFKKSPEDISLHLSVISWILPITSKIRESNYRNTATPSRLWISVQPQGEKLLKALHEYVVEFLTKAGYLAVAPANQPYCNTKWVEERRFSNWSEKHIAYAAGLGTFGLSGSLITERGIAHHCGSVVTNLALPASRRIAQNIYANCLFHTTGKCKACAARCPVGAITENGHDDRKCSNNLNEMQNLEKKYNIIGHLGCGMCYTKVPCEFRNPTKNLNNKPE
jgi:epoxyqueuosine reductase